MNPLYFPVHIHKAGCNAKEQKEHGQPRLRSEPLIEVVPNRQADKGRGHEVEANHARPEEVVEVLPIEILKELHLVHSFTRLKSIAQGIAKVNAFD
jgi:hypothetical protein